MLVDISRALGGYLHDVFVGNMDWGILIGYVAQILFAMRFVVQWIASERAHRSEEHTSELQSHSDLHSFPTRRSSDLCVRRQHGLGHSHRLRRANIVRHALRGAMDRVRTCT